MSDCKLLKLIKERINSGMTPEEAIPYSMNCTNEDEYYEVLYYAAQVLPEGVRRESIRNKLKELDYVRRTAGQL